MSRVYTVQFNGVGVSAQQDLFEITAASGKNCRILGVSISQSSDVGDAAEEGLLLRLRSGMTTSGSGGTTPTKVRCNVTDTAAGFSAEANNTTKASVGTIVVHHSEVWNVRAGFLWLPPDRMQIELTGGRRFSVELATTPVDEVTASGTIYVEEFG